MPEPSTSRPGPDGEVAFVVAGAPPSALAVGAEHVRHIGPEHAFTGARVVDLRSYCAPNHEGATPPDGAIHVLVVGQHEHEVGLLVRGRIRFLVVRRSDIVPLPTSIELPSLMSHGIASRGVPRIPVVDLARLDSERDPA